MLIPPISTFEALTLGSSTSVGVYAGCSVTSCPRAISAVASELSRRQLPQYIPAAPAVMERILRGTSWFLGAWVLGRLGSGSWVLGSWVLGWFLGSGSWVNP